MIGEAIEAYLRVVAVMCAVITAICIAAAFGIGYWFAQPKPQTFADWFSAHKQTCPECGAGTNQPTCEESLGRLAKYFQEGCVSKRVY